MTSSRDPERLIDAFLAEGRTELPDRTYDEVRAQIDRTRQRAVMGPWGAPRSTVLRRLAVPAAAVLAVVIGVNLLPGMRGIGRPAATTLPTRTPSPVLLPTEGTLDTGRYLIRDTAVTRVPFSLAVPAGWSTIDYAILGLAGDRSFRLALSPWVVDSVYADACRWREGLSAPPPGNSVAALANTLVSQGSREATGPLDVTVGDHPAKLVEFSVPAGIKVDDCDDAELRMWSGPDGTKGGYYYGPGQRDRVYLVDVGGEAVVLHAMWLPSASADDLTELDGVMASIEFEPSGQGERK